MTKTVIFIEGGDHTLHITLPTVGKQLQVARTHPNYVKIGAAVRRKSPLATPEEILKLCDVQAAVQQRLAKSDAEIRGGVVYFQGEAVHNTLAARILKMNENGEDVQPWLLFMKNLMENPSMRSREELIDFLADKGMPLTEDGHFLAYKGIQQDYKDIYSKTFDNSPGQVLSMDRGKVDDDRANECSRGFHVGRFAYANDYKGGGRLMLVKVNPRDAVSVPKDHNCSKLRVCRYEVLSEYTKEEFITSNVSDTGSDSGVSESAVESKATQYAESYNRDEAAALATRRGLFATKASARAAGKEAVCQALAEHELGLLDSSF